jgi:membrane protein
MPLFVNERQASHTDARPIVSSGRRNARKKAVTFSMEAAKKVSASGCADITAGAFGTARHRKSLRKMRWCEIKPLLEECAAGWTKHRTPRLGAALAFYTLLSLMPLLLIFISIAGLVFGPRAAQIGVLQQIQILIGAQRAKMVQALLDGAQNKADGFAATAVGMLTLVLGASGVLTELRDALNTIWDVAPRNLTTFQEIANLVKERLWSFVLVLAIGLLLTGLLLLSTWIAAVGTLYASILPWHEVPLHVLNAISSFVLVTGLFGAIYKIVPEVPIEWRDVALGATVTSMLFTLGNSLLGLYLGKASFSSTYGAAASTVVLAVWVYYSSQIFFLGAEFTKAFAERYGSDPGQLAHHHHDPAANVPLSISPPTSITPAGESASVRHEAH